MAGNPVELSSAQALQHITSDAYLREIGRVVTQWSLMETMLDACIWQAGGLRNDLGRVICAQQQVNSKLDTLAALLMQRKPVLGEQFAVVVDYVRNCLQGKRNTVAHGVWQTEFMNETDPAKVTKFAAKGRLTSQPPEMTLADLKATALDIAEVTVWLLLLSPQLPKLRQRPGGLGHKTPDPPAPQGCAARKLRALQSPTASRTEWESRFPEAERSKRLKARTEERARQKRLALAAALKNHRPKA